jgi:hypothetical protein
MFSQLSLCRQPVTGNAEHSDERKGSGPMDFEQAAYHEAGHLVVAHRLRLRLRAASLFEHCRHHIGRHHEPLLMPDVVLDAWTRRKLEGRAMATLAGVECELQHFGRSDGSRARVDHHDATDIALYMSLGDAEEAVALLAWLRTRVVSLLRRPEVGADVERVALVLLDRKELSRPDVEALLRSALPAAVALDPSMSG